MNRTKSLKQTPQPRELNLRDIERQRAIAPQSAQRAFCAYDKPAREGYAPECEQTRDDLTEASRQQ